jgi:hypothetical protein
LVTFPGRCVVAQGLGGARQTKDGLWTVWCSQQGFPKVGHRFRGSIEVEQEIPGEFSCRNDGIGQPNSPYYVVECKGSQTDRNTSYDQLRGGLEQVPAIVIAPGARQVVTFIIATCMLENETEVLVLDPPPSSPDDPVGKEQARKRSKETKERTWRVRDPEIFYRRALIAEDSNLLKWAGQYRAASGRDAQLRGLVPAELAPDNAPLEIKKTDFGVFLGTEHLLFPELGIRDLRIFTGVDQALLESLIRQPRDLELAQRPVERQPRFDHVARERLPANISISGDGGYMIVEGV